MVANSVIEFRADPDAKFKGSTYFCSTLLMKKGKVTTTIQFHAPSATPIK